MFKTILIACDGSNQSSKALDKAIGLARLSDAELLAIFLRSGSLRQPTAMIQSFVWKVL